MKRKATATSDLEIVTASASATQAAGKLLAKYLCPGDIICLEGDLGTGKTVFARGISMGLGIRGCDVISPTFVLMRCHQGRLPVYHFDLYRIGDPAELTALGYEEFFFSDGVCVIEWAERLGFLVPRERLTVRFAHSGKRRKLRLTADGGRYNALLAEFKRAYKR